MKKSKYISKYDYLGFYTKQPNMWFYSNAEIKAEIEYELDAIKKLDNDELDDDQDDAEETEIDSYEYYKEMKFEQKNQLTDETHVNKKYQDFLAQTKELDSNNILMVEGNILDKWSKNHVQSVYAKNQCHVIDYDDEQYTYLTNEELFDITIKDFFAYKNLILFQPTFIWKEKQLITKCDALVKLDKDIYIIETKGTSSSRLIHVCDLFFQSKVVENSLNEIDSDNTFLYYYRLCIIDYVKAPFFSAPFVIIETSGISKGPTTCPVKSKSFLGKQNAKRGIRVQEDFDHTVYFDEVFNWSFESVENDYADKLISSREKETRLKVVKIFNEFDDAIEQLKARKKYLETQLQDSNNLKPETFVPSFQDKGLLKNSDFWPDLRKLYVNKGYTLLEYTGNFLRITAEFLSQIKPNMTINQLFQMMQDEGKNVGKQREEYEKYFADYVPAFSIDLDAWNYHYGRLKNKKVYFDFESINPAIRAVENSTPFLQAITQCSIIKDHCDGTPIRDVKCLNMCRHPRHLDIPWMKEIIDNLYEGNKYSYIVFNQSFEKTRLKEMAEFINEDEYSAKVTCIVENIVDLAEWYNYKGKKLDKNIKIACPIVAKELHGFYSIKKVLPLVSKYNPEIYNETKCVSYVDGLLTVHNGTECQTETTKYFFDIPTELTWEEFLASIQCYCENDVRAMIAVEYLAKDIVENLDYYNQLAIKLNQN